MFSSDCVDKGRKSGRCQKWMDVDRDKGPIAGEQGEMGNGGERARSVKRGVKDVVCQGREA